ncbi:phBC6A51 family helix-turn-helix protein [Bacillus sp. JJ634]
MANNAKSKAEELVMAIEKPLTVSDKEAHLARLFVKAKMLEGFNVTNFCSENRISTKTWYAYMENPDFKYYLNEVQNAIIPDDEREAYQRVKKKILQIAYKQDSSIKEIELFTNTFSYLVEADKRERMNALGLTDEHKPNTEKSIEQKKASLLGRLMGTPNQTTNKGEDE